MLKDMELWKVLGSSGEHKRQNSSAGMALALVAVGVGMGSGQTGIRGLARLKGILVGKGRERLNHFFHVIKQHV